MTCYKANTLKLHWLPTFLVQALKESVHSGAPGSLLTTVFDEVQVIPVNGEPGDEMMGKVKGLQVVHQQAVVGSDPIFVRRVL